MVLLEPVDLHETRGPEHQRHADAGALVDPLCAELSVDDVDDDGEADEHVR